MSNDIALLLEEKKIREEFEIKLLAALNLGYKIVNKNEVTAKESATAGNLYSFLSIALNLVNSSKFQGRVKQILIKKDIIKPVSHGGMLWLKGLIALDNTTDLAIASKCLTQHYKDRETYRNKQREIGKKSHLLA